MPTHARKRILNDSPVMPAVLPVHGQTAAVEMIAPATATAWLKRGGKQRKLSERRANRLAASYRRGEWKLNGETIILDKDGCVLDGKHRLTACERSGVTIFSWVVRGVDPDAQDVMDTLAAGRGAGDVLSMDGVANANASASVGRSLFLIERFKRPEPRTVEAELQLSPLVIVEYAKDHNGEITSGIRLAETFRKKGLVGSLSAWATAMTLFLRIDTEDAYKFAHYMATGADMGARHPVLKLRNQVLNPNSAAGKSKDSRELIIALAIKAWNAMREGRELKYLAWRADGPQPEAFPVPV